MCVMGTIPAEELPRMSIASGAGNFLHILKQMVSTAKMSGLTRHELPNMRQLLARYEITQLLPDNFPLF